MKKLAFTLLLITAALDVHAQHTGSERKYRVKAIPANQPIYIPDTLKGQDSLKIWGNKLPDLKFFLFNPSGCLVGETEDYTRRVFIKNLPAANYSWLCFFTDNWGKSQRWEGIIYICP